MNEVLVRAYDLGGFGDIAGAMRVASFLQKTGINTRIKAKSNGALEKLKILNPDVPFEGKVNREEEAIQIDVAGHYKDERNDLRTDVPHNFTEDMDNPQDRRKLVPIYLKTGLTNTPVQTSSRFNVSSPMFYRPFREWDLPKPGERDVRAQIKIALSRKNPPGLKRFLKFSQLEKVLECTERIGFAHLSPAIQELPPEILLEHPYLYAVHKAKMNYGNSFGIGLFLNPILEARLSNVALGKYWNVVRSNGDVLEFDKDLPTLIFLGSQSQTTTTSLFLSSNIPNLVTGDLSLSDALYGLIAMEGQGFFYETPNWKIPTHRELIGLLKRYDPLLADVYVVGSNFLQIPPDKKKAFDESMEQLVSIFGNENQTREYTSTMRDAVRNEIKRRFGNVDVEPKNQTGFYIPQGAPYLIQDATTSVVQTLREDPDTLSEVENVRNMLQRGVPVTVNVSKGVLEPAPKIVPKVYVEAEPYLLSFTNNYYEKNSYIKKNLYTNLIFKEDNEDNIYEYSCVKKQKYNQSNIYNFEHVDDLIYQKNFLKNKKIVKY